MICYDYLIHYDQSGAGRKFFFHQMTQNKGNEKRYFLVELLDPSVLKKVQEGDPVLIKEGGNLPNYSTVDIEQ